MRQTTESVPGFPPDVAMPVTGASKSPALGIDPPASRAAMLEPVQIFWVTLNGSAIGSRRGHTYLRTRRQYSTYSWP
jgi:hypothetical protein